jgi:hypothetical protein
VQVHGGKDNLIDGNLFLDCFAGVSFSRWGEARWLDTIAPFLAQGATPLYAGRYPSLATLKTGADVNDVSRNLFVRCGRTFLRDGGVPRSALNGVTAEALDPSGVASRQALQAQTLPRQCLFEPIPLPDIGPYAHPWQAAPDASP